MISRKSANTRSAEQCWDVRLLKFSVQGAAALASWLRGSKGLSGFRAQDLARFGLGI